MKSIFEQIISNIAENKSNVSFGASIFLYFFIGVTAYLLFFRVFLLGRIISRKPVPRRRKKRHRKSIPAESDKRPLFRQLLQWLVLAGYKNSDRYIILHPRCFTLAYWFNWLYLFYLAVHPVVILTGFFLQTFREVSITLFYVNVYFLVMPITAALFVLMVYDKFAK